MKKFITASVVTLILTFAVYAAANIWVFNAQSYTTSEAAAADTSNTVTVRYWEQLDLLTTFTGSDSVKCIIYVDGYFKGKWDNGLVQDSLIVDNGSGDYTKYMNLRGFGGNSVPYTSIRVRNVISSGAADDSSSALLYYQKIIGR